MLRRPAGDALGASHTFTLTNAHPAVKKRTHGVLCNRQRPEKGETIATMSPCPGSAQTGSSGTAEAVQPAARGAVDPWRAELGALLSFTEIRQGWLCFTADAGIEDSLAAKSSGEVFAVRCDIVTG
jgi:hypothetical protein